MSQRWLTTHRFEDDLIPRFWRSLCEPENTLMRRLTPDFRIDFHESDDAYIVSADLPGMNKEDIKVAINNNRLDIEAERKEEHTQDNERTHYVERSFGHIKRSMELPRSADTTNVRCTYNNGVLNVHVGKRDVSANGGKYVQIE